jgi:hypothetical protein
VVDRDSVSGAPVFNRTVPLKDAWARAQAGAVSGARQLNRE